MTAKNTGENVFTNKSKAANIQLTDKGNCRLTFSSKNPIKAKRSGVEFGQVLLWHPGHLSLRQVTSGGLLQYIFNYGSDA